MVSNLSEEEKGKRRQYARERYRNFSEEEKEKKCKYDREWYKKSSRGWKAKVSWVYKKLIWNTKINTGWV